jgi:hypothetical protein
MALAEQERWLETDESKAVGWSEVSRSTRVGPPDRRAQAHARGRSI